MRAPVGARDVRPLTPLGTHVIDADLGYPAATLTAADPAAPGARGEPGIAFAFTGIPGSECELYDEGWSGEELRLRIAYAIEEPVFRLSEPTRCNGRLRYLRLETVRTEMRRTKPFKLPRRSDRQLSCANGIYG